MRVRLLGPVTAETDQGLLPLGGRKQRAVFALLALQVNHAVSLDRLVHEVWRDEPPAQSTLSLQSYISRLRRTLSGARPGDPSGPQILTRAPGWVLLMPAEEVDAVEFVRLAQAGSALLDEGRTTTGASMLTAALALWSGEALSDLGDLPFAAGEKARLDEVRVGVAESLLWAELDLGRADRVVSDARRLVSANPYRERAWCALMLALYRVGRQADALAAARELREILAEGLGVDPSPEARLMQEQILAQDPALEAPSDRSTPLPSAARPTGPAEPLPGSAAAAGLVGRRATMEALDGVVADAARGVGRFVVVDGAAGMGKSALLGDLAQRTGRAGGLVLRGSGVSAGASPALWPWVAILRQLVDAQPEIVEGARTGGTTAALALLDPSVVGGGGEVRQDGGDPVLARTRLYRAVVDLLASAHRTRRLALIVDDAHWLDPDTLGLLSVAAEELVPAGVVIAVALRGDEAAAPRARLDAVAARHHDETLQLSLAGLVADDVEELVGQGVPEADLPSLARALVARTGGNPFFVREVLRLLTSERRLDVASVDTVFPHQVRDVLRRRIDRLPERTRALLVVVAELSGPADLGLLTGVTGLDVEAVLDDAEAAVASSLLVEDPSAGRFALSHDLVRQTLTEPLSAARRARLHARIAEVMQAEQERQPTMLPETVVEIARHLVLAEAVVGAHAAIPYLVRVADDARSRSAYELAERALRRALELSARVEDPVRRVTLEFELRTRLALQSNVISGPPGSRIFGDSADRVDALLPQAARDPMAWWGAQVMHVAEGRPATALAAAETELTGELRDSVRAMVHSVAGLSYFITGRLELGDAHLATAEEIGELARARDPRSVDPWIPSMRVSAPTIRSAIAVLRGDHDSAAAHLDRARERARSSPNELVLVEHHAAWGAASRGDVDTALDRARCAIELGEKLGDTFYLPMSRVVLGWAQAMGGAASGVDVACAACAACEAIGLRFQVTVHLMLCAEAADHHGRHEEARELVRQAGAMAELTGERTLSRRLQDVGEAILRAGG